MERRAVKKALTDYVIPATTQGSLVPHQSNTMR